MGFADHSLLALAYQDKCTVGIFPIKRPEGTITRDAGWYKWTARDGDGVERQCISGKNGTGGHGNTGMGSKQIVCI